MYFSLDLDSYTDSIFLFYFFFFFLNESCLKHKLNSGRWTELNIAAVFLPHFGSDQESELFSPH